MQLDVCEFEVVPDDGPTEEQKRDPTWLDSREGVYWCVSQMPKGRDIPRGAQREVILRRVMPLFSNPNAVRPLIPRAMAENKIMFPCRYHQIKKGEGVRDDDFHYFLIWQMPYYHTMEVSHVNAYNDWLTHGRPWFHTESLSNALFQRKMYDICKAIARERKNLRLRAA